MIEFAEFLAEVSALDPDGRPEPGAPRREPYDWQQSFAEKCLSGEPPGVVAVPTGAGKTTAVDALVWALAAQAVRNGDPKRTLGVRIVWAIDRRLLVDEVHEHASRLARRLELALADSDDPLHEAATALAGLSGDKPLVATRWRGGLKDRVELHGPTQPEVITSTVAQIGSRLLFRGYGVGRRSQMITAGLVGCDTTICLDEAHLAEPFRETVDQVVEQQGEGSEPFCVPPLRLIELTATPRSDTKSIQMSGIDQRQLGRRWTARKTASLATPQGSGDGAQVDALTGHCLTLLDEDCSTVACVANTVARARKVWNKLRAKLGDEVDVGLLVGPQRQADREGFLNAERRAVLFEGQEPEKPIVVVATQTIEVGLDIDVEALVTESASSSALVQRLGRLNRRGAAHGRAVIVRDADSWLYGDDEKAAWSWLESLQADDGNIDVSVRALHEDKTRPVPAPRAHAPLLTENDIFYLAQTAPGPHQWCDPDVEAFIKGAESDSTADVELCWRSDLHLDPDDLDVERSKELLRLAPPTTRELLRLDVANAKSLLARLLNPSSGIGTARAALEEADVEGQSVAKDVIVPPARETAAGFVVIRRREMHFGRARRDEQATITVSEIKPGDLVVLPTQLGGCDEHGLNPLAETANDVGVDADPKCEEVPEVIRLTVGAIKSARKMGRAPYRAVDGICESALRTVENTSSEASRQRTLRHSVERLAELMPTHNALVKLVNRLDEEHLVLSLQLLGKLDEEGVPVLEPFEEEELVDGEVESEKEDAFSEDDEDDGEDKEDDEKKLRDWVLLIDRTGDDDRDQESTPPSLTEHSEHVRKQLERFIAPLNLEPQVENSLLLAADCHDLGKLDPRFQAFLYGGRAPLAAEPIAKSRFGNRDRRESRIAAAAAGLPKGFAHEVESVAVVADAARQLGEELVHVDLDLLLTLVGGHHGRTLPVPGPQSGGAPARPFSADVNGVRGTASGNGAGWGEGEWLTRYWRVIRRYGPWRFAYLLGLLVLADRTASAMEEGKASAMEEE